MARTYKDAVAVITGGASGIGLALTRSLAAEGAKVVIASTNEERIDQAVSSIQTEGGTALGVRCDVSLREDVANLLAAAVEKFGRVDLLCANAGVTTAGPLLDHRPADWDWIYDVVLRGVSNCVETFYPYMVRQGGGQMLITGSQSAFVSDWLVNHGPYTSAKWGVMALAIALRAEAAEHNVGVSLLIPAGTGSPMIEKSGQSRQGRYGGQVEFATKPTPRPGAPLPDPAYPERLSTAEVARIALDGLRVDKAVIATHKSMRPIVAEFLGRLQSAWDPEA